MREYELMVILDPQLDERAVPASMEKVTKVVTNNGGTAEVDVWGKRRLAYEILKRSEGIYVVIKLKTTPADAKELDRQLTLNESVLRTKLMRLDTK